MSLSRSATFTPYMLLRDHVVRHSHRLFVGRAEECALFRDALERDVWPWHLLHVHGPGGIGKTALLNEFRYFAHDAKVPVLALDVRDMGSTPESFAHATHPALHRDQPSERFVLTIDGVEIGSELSDWLRRSLLPSIDDRLLVVLSSRRRPAADWMDASGWSAEMRMIRLANLSPAESQAFLKARDVPDPCGADALRLTHGHPFALALVADHCCRHPGQRFHFDAQPDIVRTLLQRFIEETPSGRHRKALEAAALTRTLTQPLLEHLLGEEDALMLFDWLRARTFIESEATGLFPHELAREVLAADLRWRDPDFYSMLHARARRYYADRLLKAPSEEARHRTLADFAFLYRDNALVRPMLDLLMDQWSASAAYTADTFLPSDAPALLDMVRRHRGSESERIARYWFDRHPQGVEVYRSEDGTPAGFLLTLDLHEATEDDRAADPACASALRYLSDYSSLRRGESAPMFRFWMDGESYQNVSAVQSLVFATTVRRYLTTPRLAVTLLACADATFWTPVFSFADLRRLQHAETEIDGQVDAVFGHDWRATPPAAWLEALVDRMPQAGVSAPPEPVAPTVVLNESDFADAIREVLYQYARPHKLRSNPLLHSRLVNTVVPTGADEDLRIESLCALVLDAARVLSESPREAPYFNAIQAACLKPAPTHALAAERIGVAFSTFRRHLGRGIAHVARELWLRETEA